MELQWPLIIFTTLISWSAGLFAAQSVFSLKGEGAKAQMPSLIASLVIMALGGIAVFFHLEHWERIFNGFGHLSSGITQELIAIVVVVILMVIAFVFLRRDEGAMPKWLAILGIVFSAVLVVVMGHSYMMAARPTWDSILQIGSLLGAACVLGPGTFVAIASFLGEETTSFGGLLVLVGAAINAVLTCAYAAVMNATHGFAAVEFYYDPTRPTRGIIDPAEYGSFAGESMTFAVAAIVFVLVALVFAVLGKRDGKWKIWGIALVACAVIGAVCLRIAFYLTGGSMFYMML